MTKQRVAPLLQPSVQVLRDVAENTVQVRIADVVGCLTTKDIKLGERYHDKAAYDIYSVIKHLRGGPAGAAQAVRPRLNRSLVREGVDAIAERFRTIGSTGPQGVGRFLASDSAEMAGILADAFIAIRACIELVSKSSPPARAPTWRTHDLATVDT